MILSRFLLGACVALLPAVVPAQSTKTDYALNDGAVHFRVPPVWTAVMEKNDGDPQAVAFLVPDAAAQDSNDTATVTIKTQQLANAAAFAASMQDEYEHAKSQPGFANDPTNKDTSAHQYFVQRATTRYVVRDSSKLLGTIAVHVRCQRPLLERTPAAWIAQFDAACRTVAASVQP